MRKLASLLAHESHDLAAIITLEMGKPLHTARPRSIEKCASACRYYADNAVRILAPESIPTENHSYVRWDPLGVILAVMPWNFPFWQVFRFLAPALMAGNTALLKHSSNVPQCSLSHQGLPHSPRRLPRGTFQSLLIEARQVESVLADPRVAAVTVTGSEPAGRAIAAQSRAGSSKNLSSSSLSGSDPFLVMPSADLDLAVETAIRARCVNSGQSCIAAKRFIVHEDIYPAFESRFVAGMEAMQVGDPMKDSRTDIGHSRHPADRRRPRSPGQSRHPLQAPASSPAAIACSATDQLLRAGPHQRPPRLARLSRRTLRSRRRTLFHVRDLDEAASPSPTTHPSASPPPHGPATPPNSNASSPSSSAEPSSSTPWSPATHACPSVASKTQATDASSPPQACVNSSTPKPSSLSSPITNTPRS